jgi:hypothetical protein
MTETTEALRLRWTRGRPGETLDVNRRVVKAIGCMIKAGERDEDDEDVRLLSVPIVMRIRCVWQSPQASP